MSIRLGDGLGGFSGTTDASVGGGPTSLAIGDFNNDGNQDFAVAKNFSNTISIRLGGCVGDVQVSGRVVTSDGRGLRNATVSITNSQGVVRTATTSSFGLFSFSDISIGETYTVRIVSRLYRYTPQIVQVNGSLTLPDFVGLE